MSLSPYWKRRTRRVAGQGDALQPVLWCGLPGAGDDAGAGNAGGPAGPSCTKEGGGLRMKLSINKKNKLGMSCAKLMLTTLLSCISELD